MQIQVWWGTKPGEKAVLSEDLQGVTTFEALHSGQMRVARIIDIRIDHEGVLRVFVEPRALEPELAVPEPEAEEEVVVDSDIPF